MIDTSAGCVIQPEFQSGSAGSLFVQQFLPPSGGQAATCVVVPPFAEEMNRSRRTMALLGAQLADKGASVILPDLFGTGDSEGNFEEARWSIWARDLMQITERCKGSSPLWVVGLRVGCLLAARLAEELSASRLVLLQPATSGGSFMRQFFRIATASALAGNQSALTSKEIAAALGNGQPVTVGGYTISPGLYAEFEKVRLEDSRPQCPVHWFEIGALANIPPAAQRAADKWAALADTEVKVEMVDDPPFWRTQEISVGLNSIVRTTEVLLT